MFCGKCGAKNLDSAKFCKDCGNPLAREPINTNQNKASDNSQASKPDMASGAVSKNKNPKKQNKLVAFLKKSKKNKIIFFGSLSLLLLLIIAGIIAIVVVINNNIENRITSMLYDSRVAKTGIIPSQYTDESDYHMEDLEITNYSDSYSNGSMQKEVEFNAVILNDYFRTEISGNASFNTSGDVTFSKQPYVSWSDTVPTKGVTKIDYKVAGTTTEKYDFDIASFSSSITEENGIYKCKATEGVEFNFGFCVDKANLSQNYKFDKREG